MAKDKEGLIIVPRPGEVLKLLGVGGALDDAIDDLIRVKREAEQLSASSTKIGIDWGSGYTPGVAMDGAAWSEKWKQNYQDFKAQLNGEWPPPLEHEPEIYSDEAVEGGITKQTLNDAFEVIKQATTNDDVQQPSWWDLFERWDSVDIAFWYYRNTQLIYSLRRVADNFFYDFANKTFRVMPNIPRAGMPRTEMVKPSGYIYSTRLSGKLDDGEYVVTIRDSYADDVVIGIMAIFMKDGVQREKAVKGLEDTPIEEGIPMPESSFRRAEQRVRMVDTGGS